MTLLYGGRTPRRSPRLSGVSYIRRYCRRLWPDVPIVLGGIEGSLRRLSHYDYWQDRLRPSILLDAKADLLVYGMGEQTIREIAHALDSGHSIDELTDTPQTARIVSASEIPAPDADNIILHSWDECKADKRLQSANFKHIEQQSNRMHGATIWQRYGDVAVRVNPMLPPMTTEEIDASFDLPYTRLPPPTLQREDDPGLRNDTPFGSTCTADASVGARFAPYRPIRANSQPRAAKESIMRGG